MNKAQILDFLALTKPRITLMTVLMALGGMALAPQKLEWSVAFFLVTGTILSVGSANTLNMYWERDTDKLMRRTAGRPLPAGRINASHALWFGVVLGVLSTILLLVAVNPLTALLSTLGLLGYVLIYTPLKRRTPLALIIGAIPGAVPPLMGWTAATNRIDMAGFLLFLILLIWQMPHFIAIALYLKKDYQAAGICTVPNVRGDKVAKLQAAAYSFALIPVSILLVGYGVASYGFLMASFIMGIAFFVMSLWGLKTNVETTWARNFFVLSLLYLPAITLGLCVDRIWM